MKALVIVLAVLSALSVAWALVIVFKGDATQGQLQLLAGILFVALGGYLLLLALFFKAGTDASDNAE